MTNDDDDKFYWLVISKICLIHLSTNIAFRLWNILKIIKETIEPTCQLMSLLNVVIVLIGQRRHGFTYLSNNEAFNWKNC
jgi:hypothetical protein